MQNKPQSEFPKTSAPASRALENAKIKTLKDLSKWTEKELLTLHGLGPASIPILRKALKAKGLSFSNKKSDSMNKDITSYNEALLDSDRDICNELATEINAALPEAENKIWHGHPVWFLEGNPVVGYSKLKDSVRLLFWSGQGFEEEGLQNEGSFKAADARYTSVDQINKKDLKRWLKKSKDIQWDYKNIVKRKGVLKRLK